MKFHVRGVVAQAVLLLSGPLRLQLDRGTRSVLFLVLLHLLMLHLLELGLLLGRQHGVDLVME